MKKYKVKCQNGGFSEDFLNALDYLSSQNNDNYPEEQDSDYPVQEQFQQQGYDEQYVNDLLDKYNELEQRLKSLEFNNNEQDDDNSFLNFLFDGEDNRNPANIDESILQYKPFKQQISKKGFRTFNTPEEGRAALEHQLELYKSGASAHTTGNETLYEAMSKYAPSSDNNNPKAYADFIGKKLGISPDTPIKQVDTKKWADAITIMEGNKTGNNPGNLRSFQMGGTNEQISRLGYSDNSPFRNSDSLLINSPDGLITMENTSIPLLGITSQGEQKVMLPGKRYKFNSNLVKEIPL